MADKKVYRVEPDGHPLAVRHYSACADVKAAAKWVSERWDPDEMKHVRLRVGPADSGKFGFADGPVTRWTVNGAGLLFAGFETE